MVLEPRVEVVVPAVASRTTVSFCLKKRCLFFSGRELLCVRFPACQPCTSDGSVPCSRTRDFMGPGGAYGTCLAVTENVACAWSVRKVSSNVSGSHGRAMG